MPQFYGATESFNKVSRGVVVVIVVVVDVVVVVVVVDPIVVGDVGMSGVAPFILPLMAVGSSVQTTPATVLETHVLSLMTEQLLKVLLRCLQLWIARLH